jgi:hypothetical protein
MSYSRKIVEEAAMIEEMPNPSVEPVARRYAFQLGVILAVELNRLALFVIGGDPASAHLPDSGKVDDNAERILTALEFPIDKKESFTEALKFGREMATAIREGNDPGQRRAELAGAANFMTLAGSLAKTNLAQRHGRETPYYMLIGETTVKVLSQIKAWGTLFDRPQQDRLREYFEPFGQDIVKARQAIGEDNSLPIFLLEVEQASLRSPEDLQLLRDNFIIVLDSYFPEFDATCFDRMNLL